MKPRKPAGRGRQPRSACPIANALDLVGDKWTLLVVRDLLFVGKRQYGEFIQSGERIPTNILADRLKRLEQAGLLTKVPYQSNPVRHQYRLTRKGADLFPVLKAIIGWSNKYIPGTIIQPPNYFEKFERQFAAEDLEPGPIGAPTPTIHSGGKPRKARRSRVPRA